MTWHALSINQALRGRSGWDSPLAVWCGILDIAQLYIPFDDNRSMMVIGPLKKPNFLMQTDFK